MSLAEAIAFIEECREIHKRWAEWQESEPDWEQQTEPSKVGDAEHHRELIERYDLVLQVLREARARVVSEIASFLRHVDTLDKVPGAKLGLPEKNPLWDAAGLIEAEFEGRR